MDDKWFAIMMVGIAFAVSIPLSIERLPNKELNDLQTECVRLGYGEFVNGKFILKGGE